MGTADGRRSRRDAWLVWLWRIGLSALALLVLATGLAILNNNFSFSQPTRAEFVKSLDHSLAASTEWTISQYAAGDLRLGMTDEGKRFIANAILSHMLVDCASTSGDLRLQQLAAQFADARRTNPDLWAKLVDPAIVTNRFEDRELVGLEMYQRWILHGIAPAEVHLSAPDLEDMFSPSKYRTGKATHQLFSLYIYRQFNGDTPALQRVMNPVEDRIAAEAAFDFRVTDLYLQRIAFLLAVGRPDLVKPRWVERALDAQQSDGGWHYTWNGWGPPPFRYTFSYEHSWAHSTAQGMWLACMLKYRYPQWIDTHYK